MSGAVLCTFIFYMYLYVVVVDKLCPTLGYGLYIISFNLYKNLGDGHYHLRFEAETYRQGHGPEDLHGPVVDSVFLPCWGFVCNSLLS